MATFFCSFPLFPSLSKTMAHQNCLSGPPKAVLCAIRNISSGVEQGICPGGVFGEGWVCHCFGGRGRCPTWGFLSKEGWSVRVVPAILLLLQFTVGGNLGWKCLYKGVLPTMQQICSAVGATIPCRVL